MKTTSFSQKLPQAIFERKKLFSCVRRRGFSVVEQMAENRYGPADTRK